MKRLIDLETDSEFQELKEVLEKVRSGNILGTMKQAVATPDGNYSYIDLQQIVGTANCLFQMNGDYFYITAQHVGRATVGRMKSMWNTVLQRGTQKFQNGEANDYIFAIDVAKDESEHGYFYCISAAQPIFMTKESSDSITFVFSMNNVRCVKEEASIYDVEYDVALREEADSDVYQFDIGDFDDEEEEDVELPDVANDIIDTDKYTHM